MFLVIGDLLAVGGAQLACFSVRYYTPLLPPAGAPVYPVVLFLGLSLASAVLTLAAFGAYRLPRRFRLYTTSATLLRAMSVYLPLVVLSVYLLWLGTPDSENPFLYSRFVVGAGWLLMFCLLLAWRLAAGSLQRACFARGWGRLRVVVVGDTLPATALAGALHCQSWLGVEVVGLLGTSSDPALPFPVLGPASELPRIVVQHNVDVVWLAYTEEHCERLPELVLGTPIQPATWAMRSVDLARCLHVLSAQCPDKEGEVAAQLTTRIAHDLDPLAGPRVTFVGSRGIPATYGGVERYVEELSTRLVARGYQVSVYCRPHYTSHRGNYQGVELRRLPCINTKHLEAISHTLLATLHLLLREDEIVHYQALGPSLLAWLPRLFGRKTVVTVQGLDWQRPKWGPLARTVLKVGELASAHFPHHTVVVSRSLQRHYRERRGKSPVYIPNGANVVQPRPACEIHTLGLHAGGYLLTVGRLVPEKGVHTLIGTYRQVETDKPLVIVGGSSHSEAYVRALHRMAEGAPILFTGYAYGRVLEELYSNAYLFLSASTVEGLPISLLEAMGFGLCPLVSDLPSHLEVLRGLGHTFRTGDEKDLATQLQALLDQPHLTAQDAAALRQRAARAYKWEWVADATQRVYQAPDLQAREVLEAQQGMSA